MSSQIDQLDTDLWRKREIIKANGIWTVEGYVVQASKNTLEANKRLVAQEPSPRF